MALLIAKLQKLKEEEASLVQALEEKKEGNP